VAYKGYSVLFFPHDPANKSRKEKCRVCGGTMSVRLGVMCSSGFASAMAGIKSSHDVFECEDKEKDWHKQAESICVEAERTSSPSLRRMLSRDVVEICRRKKI